MTMRMKPFGDRIIVELLEGEEITESGIVLPDTVEKEKKMEGKIVAIGDGTRLKELKLQVGDKVLFGQYSGEDFKEEDVEYKILYVGKEEDKSDVFAVITK